jgi:hypothetical protein
MRGIDGSFSVVSERGDIRLQVNSLRSATLDGEYSTDSDRKVTVSEARTLAGDVHLEVSPEVINGLVFVS